MASDLADAELVRTTMVFEDFVTKSVNLLTQFKNIFTDKVKSNFESEDEMFAFIKQLLLRFFRIILLNYHKVSS